MLKLLFVVVVLGNDKMMVGFLREELRIYGRLSYFFGLKDFLVSLKGGVFCVWRLFFWILILFGVKFLLYFMYLVVDILCFLGLSLLFMFLCVFIKVRFFFLCIEFVLLYFGNVFVWYIFCELIILLMVLSCFLWVCLEVIFLMFE